MSGIYKKIYSKLENKNVTINEITNIQHHYDPLENVRADKTKGEQAVLGTKIEDDKYKSTCEYELLRCIYINCDIIIIS